MRVAIVNPLFRFGADESQWITVPPQGYGGIQWVIAHLVSGLAADGHSVLLLGAPGSPRAPNVTVSDATKDSQMCSEVSLFAPDVVHDHADSPWLTGAAATVRTHHRADTDYDPVRCTYLSYAQRSALAPHCAAAPVIPLPVDIGRYRLQRNKDDYLLFLGRVSEHKGVREAAQFARLVRLPLVVAGPTWEASFATELAETFADTVRFVGEVGGKRRRTLLARARAVMALSKAEGAPWGGIWCEPGATVVSEAAASGTPVIATRNGCLPEIVPGVGHVLTSSVDALDEAHAQQIIANLPEPTAVRRLASVRWGHRRIARRYEAVYRDIGKGATWG